MSEFSREDWERWYIWFVGKDCKYYSKTEGEVNRDDFDVDKEFKELLDKAFLEKDTARAEDRRFDDWDTRSSDVFGK